MSNRTIVGNIEASIRAFNSGDIRANRLVQALELHGRALEGMPYSLIKQLDGLIYELEICSFADEEEMISDAETVVQKLEQWLKSVPLSV